MILQKEGRVVPAIFFLGPPGGGVLVVVGIAHWLGEPPPPQKGGVTGTPKNSG